MIGLGSPYWYPTFPKVSSWPWDGIEGGKWDSVSQYWGYSSLVCDDWGVTALPKADTIWVNAKGVKKQFRAGYQSKSPIISSRENHALISTKPSMYLRDR